MSNILQYDIDKITKFEEYLYFRMEEFLKREREMSFIVDITDERIMALDTLEKETKKTLQALEYLRLELAFIIEEDKKHEK